ncbi:MAG: hypothetical protein JST59_17080, partial [Actinobacteria bacterium]|nr:hypothetical protein [Actinomycetota bacterium]
MRPVGADAAARHGIADQIAVAGGAHRKAPGTAGKSAESETRCASQFRRVRAGNRWIRRRVAKASRVTCLGSTTPAAVEPNVDPTSLYWGAWIGNQLTGTEAP